MLSTFDHLAEVEIAKFLLYRITLSPCPHCRLQKAGTVQATPKVRRGRGAVRTFLKVKSPQDLFGILQHGRFVSSPLFIY